MGLSAGLLADARHRAEPRRGDDPGAAPAGAFRRRKARARLTALALGLLLLAAALATGRAAAAEVLRVAVFAAPLSREGPGLLLRDLTDGDDPQLDAILDVIAEVGPDLILLTDIDYDSGGAALAALASSLADRGVDLPHTFALPPNSGVATGRDLDGNGRLGEPRDAQGYGRFAGDGGLALLSRWPFAEGARDFSSLLWVDLPGATLPGGEANADIQRLSSTAHWQVPLALPDGPATILAWSATPPVFDGPEDRNGLRAADEARLWTVLMDGGLGPPPDGRLIVMGNANLDPADGEGPRAAIAALLADSRLQDPRPGSAGGAASADPEQGGEPSLDTVDWRPPTGNLRVAYILPSAGWPVVGAGIFWPAAGDPKAALLGEDGLAAGPHRLVWVDLALE